MGVDRALIQGATSISPQMSISLPASMSIGQDTYAEPFLKERVNGPRSDPCDL